jgi:hypothetical protein
MEDEKTAKEEFENLIKLGSNLQLIDLVKPKDFATCKYARYEQLIWIAYQLVFHHGKMRSYKDERGEDVTFVEDKNRVNVFSGRIRKDVREQDAKKLYKITGVEINPDNGLFSGIALCFLENLSVRPIKENEGHGYLITNAHYSIVSSGTKKLINEKLGKKYL